MSSWEGGGGTGCRKAASWALENVLCPFLGTLPPVSTARAAHACAASWGHVPPCASFPHSVLLVARWVEVWVSVRLVLVTADLPPLQVASASCCPCVVSGGTSWGQPRRAAGKHWRLSSRCLRSCFTPSGVGTMGWGPLSSHPLGSWLFKSLRCVFGLGGVQHPLHVGPYPSCVGVLHDVAPLGA